MNTKLVVSITFLLGGLFVATSPQAQVAISEEGVTFPDDTEQTSAAILPMNCPHGDPIVWDIFAENWVCETDLTPPPTYAIGDIGPGGGIVFALNPDSNGQHGLEVSPHPDIEETWCYTQSDIDGITNIPDAATSDPNSGAHNTPLIAAACPNPGIAAKVASAYLGPRGDTPGWFLPSKDELNLIYQNLHLPGLTLFLKDTYWSSSERNANQAWYQKFTDGTQTYRAKGYSEGVRSVRVF